MAGLRVHTLVKRYAERAAVDGVSLDLASGAFATLLGPSGCGKTTLLRLIAGLDRPSSGTIEIGDRVVADAKTFVEAERRGLGMVFQSYALWPHMSVARNVALGLEVRGVPLAERSRRVEEALAVVGLEGYGGRRPAALSGGQRQRVALARCLALRPPLILLDEPLANLDAHLRETMQREFRRIHKQTGTTVVHVTHDQAEAMALADTIAVMSDGIVQQLARPEILYAEPANAMVARFVGGGALLPVEVLSRDGIGSVRVRLLGHVLRVRGTAGPGMATLCVRPEGMDIAGTDGAGADFVGAVPARVTDVIYRGGRYEVSARLDGAPSHIVPLASMSPPQIGEAICIAIRDGWVLPDMSAVARAA